MFFFEEVGVETPFRVARVTVSKVFVYLSYFCEMVDVM
jgi:hypothetical protein